MNKRYLIIDNSGFYSFLNSRDYFDKLRTDYIVLDNYISLPEDLAFELSLDLNSGLNYNNIRDSNYLRENLGPFNSRGLHSLHTQYPYSGGEKGVPEWVSYNAVDTPLSKRKVEIQQSQLVGSLDTIIIFYYLSLEVMHVSNLLNLEHE